MRVRSSLAAGFCSCLLLATTVLAQPLPPAPPAGPAPPAPPAAPATLVPAAIPGVVLTGPAANTTEGQLLRLGRAIQDRIELDAALRGSIVLNATLRNRE